MNLRQQMIAEAIKTIGGKPTFGAIAAALPPDFELVQLDLDEMPPLPPPPIDADFTVVENGDGDMTDTTAKVIEPTGMADEPVEPTTIEAAENALVVATDNLANARNAMNGLARREREANARLAREIQRWQSGFTPYSPEQLRRDHINAEQAERARLVKSGGVRTANIPTPGNSVIDRQRAWARGTGPDSGQGNPGRAIDMQSGQRILPQSARGAYVGPPKVPSVR